jgi:hypothetical protein
VLDNRGYGCIQRLQAACGGASFNNMLDDCVAEAASTCRIDFAAHAAALGADSVHVPDIAGLRARWCARAPRRRRRSSSSTPPRAHDRRRRLLVGGRRPGGLHAPAVDAAAAARATAKRAQRP